MLKPSRKKFLSFLSIENRQVAAMPITKALRYLSINDFRYIQCGIQHLILLGIPKGVMCSIHVNSYKTHNVSAYILLM